MKQRISVFLADPKGKLIAAVSVLVLVWIVILATSIDGLDSLMPDEADIAEVKREMIRQQKSYDKAREEKQKSDKLYADYKKVIEEAWREDKHGMVDTEFRRLISQAARSVSLALDSLGAVKSSRINTDFYYAELDVSVRANYEDVVKFIKAVEQVTPHVTWRRIDIRPDRRPPHLGGQNNQGSITARVLNDDNSSRNMTRVGFNGTLRIIGFDGKVPPQKTTRRTVK